MLLASGEALNVLWAALLLAVYLIVVIRKEKATVDAVDTLMALVKEGQKESEAASEVIRQIGRSAVVERLVSLGFALAFGIFVVPLLAKMIQTLVGSASLGGGPTVIAYLFSLVLSLCILALIDFGVRRLGKKAADSPAASEKDAALLAIRSQAFGPLGDIQRQLLAHFFSFNEKNVGDFAVPTNQMAALPSSMRNREAVEAVRQIGFTRYPVYDRESQRIIGIVHLRDVLDAAEKKPNGLITDYMHTPLYLLPHTPATSALEQMWTRRAHLAIVADEQGRSEGLISIEDVIGQIVQNDDKSSDPKPRPNPIEEISQGVYEVDGSTFVSDLLDVLHVDTDYVGVETVSGYVFGRLGRKPQVGDCLHVGDLHLDVLEVTGTQVTRLRAKRNRTAPPAS